MIAEVLKEDVFSFEEMAEVLFSRKTRLPTPKARQGKLRRRIREGTEHPPYWEFDGEVYFPRAAFREWASKRALKQEKKRAG